MGDDDDDDDWNTDDPGEGSCARCGCNLLPDDDELCDHCEWLAMIYGCRSDISGDVIDER